MVPTVTKKRKDYRGELLLNGGEPALPLVQLEGHVVTHSGIL
jgi:hypothetical protein